MFTLKPISRDAIPAALAKAERYRLLNEPREAESICRDILSAEPGHQRALVTLLLALTDQFGRDHHVDIKEAREVLALLQSDYDRAYYAGVVNERWGKGQLTRGLPPEFALDWFRHAMASYEAAEVLSPPKTDDAVLRWNACARIIMREQQSLLPAPPSASPPDAMDDVALL